MPLNKFMFAARIKNTYPIIALPGGKEDTKRIRQWRDEVDGGGYGVRFIYWALRVCFSCRFCLLQERLKNLSIFGKNISATQYFMVTSYSIESYMNYI